MHRKLQNRYKTSHLSANEVEELKQAYYYGEKVDTLVKKYNIDIHPTNLCSTFPLIYSPEVRCKYCNSGMYFVPPLKSAKNRKEYFCTVCEHTEGILVCKCNQCLVHKGEKKAEIETAKLLNKKKILHTREYPHAHMLESLSIKSKAYLGALLRTNLHKGYLLLDLRENPSHIFAPTEEYRNKIIVELLEHKILVPYKPTKNAEHNLLKYYSHGTLYDICVADSEKNKLEIITFLMYPDQILSSKENEAYEVLYEIQIYEAIEYMMITLNQFNLYPFEIEQKYILLFTQILNNYSESQLFNFIYTAIRNLAADHNKSSNKYRKSSNYLYKSISNRYEKAIQHNWNITNFRRSWNGQQSEISKLVTNYVLKIGDLGFYEVLSQKS